ncbi:enoyl-CoA hydratase/isomerase family protein [Humitalea sp. 24SJ18S-53]|uniref:enoyl-CoA hydratase/isomerase family protein n=1 Tax=Humitalea sp. 24SJ18S-53 TaxID=3422307 RepID=UPI003D67BE5B
MAEEEVVLFAVSGGIAWVTLNRPAKLNAVNAAMRAALGRAARMAAEDAQVRVVVLRGAGPRAFCAGADIHEFDEVPSAAEARQSRMTARWLQPLEELRKPVLASIHGYCLGGGLEMALACDIRICAEDASFGFPETGLGMLTGVGGSQRLPRAVGTALAMDMMLTGDRISAGRALTAGLVTRIVPPAALAAETEALARQLAARSPLALAFAKEAIHAAQDLPLQDGLRLETDLLSLLLNTPERITAVRAFGQMPGLEGGSGNPEADHS